MALQVIIGNIYSSIAHRTGGSELHDLAINNEVLCQSHVVTE